MSVLRRLGRLSSVVVIVGLVTACGRTLQPEGSAPVEPPAPAVSGVTSPALPGSDASPLFPGPTLSSDGGASPADWSPPLPAEVDGPHEDVSLEPGRPIFHALKGTELDGGNLSLRLVGHLHGMCGPPSYACGRWLGAGSDVGLMVCPTGNARCGDPGTGPPSWEAPTWPELVDVMDRDLESSITKVTAKRRLSVPREGAVLTGYSRGAYAAPVIARKHPGRWPYLVLIEANVNVTAASLRASGVRAVALVAGEQGTEIPGMTRTQARLEEAGFPSRLFVMKRTGHLYSDDMELVMHDALVFVLSHDAAP